MNRHPHFMPLAFLPICVLCHFRPKGGLGLFPFVGWWGRWIFVVPSVFHCVSLCLHQVLIGFPACSASSRCVHQRVPNSTSLYPISFALSSILVTYISRSKDKITIYVFWDCPSLINCFDEGTIKDAHHKRENFEFGENYD
jgi:hypothetical protein